MSRPCPDDLSVQRDIRDIPGISAGMPGSAQPLGAGMPCPDVPFSKAGYGIRDIGPQEAPRRRRRATSLTHPDHTKVDPVDRLAAVVMLRTGQWTDTAVAEQIGVSRKTVARIGERYGR